MNPENIVLAEASWTSRTKYTSGLRCLAHFILQDADKFIKKKQWNKGDQELRVAGGNEKVRDKINPEGWTLLNVLKATESHTSKWLQR